MIKIVRNCSKILAGVLLTMLLAACGSKKADTTTATSSQIPQVFYSHSVAFGNHTTLTWGLNSFGQLGNGNIVVKSTPVAVLGGAAKTVKLTGMEGVSAGGTHTLAFKNNSSVYAWGNNFYGELGDNLITASTIPVKVLQSTTPKDFLDGIIAVAAGGDQFSLALKNDKTVWAWGNNSVGQLGLKTLLTPTLEKVAVQVDITANITMIAAGGKHGLALDSDKTVWSWGFNKNGQLGRGLPYTNIPTPGQVVKNDGTGKLTGVIHIAAGGGHSLFVDSAGNVWACGLNFYGQLGDTTTTDRKDGVVQILNDSKGNAFTGATAVAAGLDHSLALIGGEVWAWGRNRNGQLGNPTNFNTDTAVTSPVKVMVDINTALQNVTKIVAIGNHSLAIVNDGISITLWAWGDNTYGQLGNGKTKDSAYAIEVTDITDPDLYMPVPLP